MKSSAPFTRPLVVLIFLSLGVVLARWHTYHEPLERDITTYAVIGHEMLSGRALYSELWDNKPPAIYWIFAAAEIMAGYGLSAVFLVNIGFSLLALWGIYVAARKLSGDEGSGLWAAAAWAVVSGDLLLQGNQPNAELILNAGLIGVVALIVDQQVQSFSAKRSISLGLLFAFLTLTKQVAIFPCAILWGVLFQKNRRLALAVLGSAAAVWMIVLAGWVFTQGFTEFFDNVVRFSLAYPSLTAETGFWQNSWQTLRVLATGQEMARLFWPLAFLGGIGLFWMLRSGSRDRAAWPIAYAIGVFFAVAFPGHFFAHYFQLFLPVLILTAALFFPRKGHLFKVIALGFLVFLEAPFYRLSAEQWSEKKYGDRFTETQKIAQVLAARLGENETFYNWGNDSGLYFYSRKRPPTGTFLNLPLCSGPLQQKLIPRVLQDLAANPPAVIAVSKYQVNAGDPDHPIVRWIRQRYKPLPNGAGDSPAYLLLQPVSGRASSGV